jgi:hypothetical protein
MLLGFIGEEKMRSIIALSTSFVLLLPPAAGLLAQEDKVPEPPSEGRTNYVVYFTENVPSEMDWGDIGNASINHLTGVTRNRDGQPFFDQMATTCISHYVELAGAGPPRLQGSCSYQDREGDRAFSTFVLGRLTYVGGTGKYAGLSGEGSLKGTSFGGPGGMVARISEVEMTWTMRK